MSAAVSRLRRRIYERIPLWVRDHAFELFTATLCVSAGIPLLVSDQVDAASIEATLPPVLVKVWSVILAVAPIAVGVGLWRQARLPMSRATFWMRLEAWGLRALAYASYIYAVAILQANALSALPAMMIVLIFGLTCHSTAAGVTIEVEDYLTAIGTDHAHP